MGYGSVTVDVDLDDVLDQFDDDDLRAELDSRRRRGSKHFFGRGVINLGEGDFAEDALDALKEGRIDDAMLILERGLRPKFREAGDVLAAYDKAMGRMGLKKKVAA
jgi:hypothetical protein